VAGLGRDSRSFCKVDCGALSQSDVEYRMLVGLCAGSRGGVNLCE